MILPLAVLVFGILVLIGVIWKQQPGWGPQTTRVFVTVLILVLATFLVTLANEASVSGEALTGAFGVLGMVAGFLFGKL